MKRTQSSPKKPHSFRRNGQGTDAGDGDWLTVREVAHYLRIGVDLVYEACAAGGLKHVKLGYRTIRLRREWVDAWAEAKATEYG